MKCFMLMVVACGAMCCRAAETADDTSYLQERIDRGGCVILPAREYRISRTLKIGSGTHVRFEDGAKILLLPGSDCPLAGNGDMTNAQLLPYACLGVACAGLVYLVLAAFIKINVLRNRIVLGEKAMH